MTHFEIRSHVNRFVLPVLWGQTTGLSMRHFFVTSHGNLWLSHPMGFPRT